MEPEHLDRLAGLAVYVRLKMRREVLASDCGGEEGVYSLTKDGIFNGAGVANDDDGDDKDGGSN